MDPSDVCPRPLPLPPLATTPHAPPIYPTSVWSCENPQQADDMLAGRLPGYVYQRDGHPNAYLLAEKCRLLHSAERAAITASGMAALAVAMLSQLQAGDHALLGNRLYGKSHQLFGTEAARLGIEMTTVDTCDLKATAAAISPKTKLLLAETIANPLLEVADVAALAEIARRRGIVLLIDNTFASPILCRPLALGADLVMESLTKTMNGHSDVILGLLAGKESVWPRVPQVISAFGMCSSPFDCWLADRGLATAHLRIERACDNALAAAEFLKSQSPRVTKVFYPGLAEHSQHALAARQFGGRFGTVVTFELAGGRPAADAFIAAAKRIPFCPSLGELNTTLSHPETTSHRGLSTDQRAALGISGGTIRLSVGTESPEFVREALAEGLRALDG
ncbi:MAG: aminotransferase class I/II-fold pyridoxal phosphate-dependent enzyme [Planctomycetaceae bacterium]|nr:aminotransferase class I/II-fold pyridoxal phosphate-dependent enzyme [Planctomycetaceae bacterium]